MRPSKNGAGLGVLTSALAAALVAAACISRRPPPEGADGPTIYEYQGCYVCHGDDGGGKSLGPALRGLSANWTREELVHFFVDPDAACEADARLAELRGRYPAAMAKYDNLTEEQRTRLAEWLLTL